VISRINLPILLDTRKSIKINIKVFITAAIKTCINNYTHTTVNSVLDMPFTQLVTDIFNLLKVLASYSFSILKESTSATRESRFWIN
jgi:hypothetical protein